MILVYRLIFLILLIFTLDLFSQEDQGVTIDLREPTFQAGVLSTDKGGVVCAPSLRIQAQKIVYTKTGGENPIHKIEASENLIIEYGEYVFVGEKLEYDFIAQTGVIHNGRTGVEPWYFGGERIELYSDRSSYIYNGFFTASENICPEWKFAVEHATLSPCYDLCAKNISFRLFNTPLLWVPKLQANLKSIYDSPIRYYVRLGGKQGPRFGFRYELFSWEHFKTFLRFDYRLNRGPGGGIETLFISPDHRTEFQTINYVARDSSYLEPHEKTRYRFEGVFQSFISDRFTVNLTYDKLSDKEMATDYADKGLELETALRTQLHARYQEDYWIGNFYSRVRINNFQTVKQELPTMETSFHPFIFGSSGIIMENRIKGSYLDFKYANDQPNVSNYCSTRFEYRPVFYRSTTFKHFTLTPEVGGVGIFYGNSPDSNPKWLFLGTFDLNVNTSFFRYYGSSKHVLEPYALYQYYTCPTVNPKDHDIFDIEDGWYRLNVMRAGVRNHLYQKKGDGIFRNLYADLFTYYFIDTPTVGNSIPKVYADITCYVLPTLKHTIETAWNFYESDLDHINYRVDWTLNENFALATEFRYRDAYDWRKVDQFNFILDSFRPVEQLRNSLLSDRRNTLLIHGFYRFLPTWALEVNSRSGWNRSKQPAYTEYEINLLSRIRSALNLKLSYQHREDDKRFVMYMSVGLKRPDFCYIPSTPYFD